MDHIIDVNQIIGRHREQLLAKSQPLTRDIMNTIVHSKHDDNKYFKKLATDIIVHFSLGNPAKAEVMLYHHLVRVLCECVSVCTCVGGRRQRTILAIYSYIFIVIIIIIMEWTESSLVDFCFS